MDKLNVYADKLRADMAHARPSISIERVMLLFGFASKDTAWRLLKKLEETGVVKHVYRKWYLT